MAEAFTFDNLLDDLHVRGRKAVHRLAVTAPEDLTKFTADDLLALKNCGLTTVNEIRQSLAAHGLYLKGEQPPADPDAPLLDNLSGIAKGRNPQLTQDHPSNPGDRTGIG